jgi:putative transposase
VRRRISYWRATEVRPTGSKRSETKRLKQLEEENAKLKRIVADQALDITMLKDLVGKMVSPQDRRAAVAHVRQAHGASERRACGLLAEPRSTQQYEAKTKPEDTLPGALRSWPPSARALVIGA